ncbi:CheY-like chemotaxis protein [Paraburkholderia sp. WC7.3g]|uniref:response regulator n=1 Tax=Paraburkholderia TaxID=1822464 RepID=UPI0028B0A398|nr:response regulator [Paraburkholderia podalyriae]
MNPPEGSINHRRGSQNVRVVINRKYRGHGSRRARIEKSTLLELEGHEVKRATNGPDALAIVESFSPDIALIDIAMPGMDGQELAELLRLRAQCSQTKLVALTGSNRATGMPGNRRTNVRRSSHQAAVTQ